MKLEANSLAKCRKAFIKGSNPNTLHLVSLCVKNQAREKKKKRKKSGILASLQEEGQANMMFGLPS